MRGFLLFVFRFAHFWRSLILNLRECHW
jgi:hypothetical protein